jgi:hypothetical protein
MKDKITIEMDKDFIGWWETTLMSNDKTYMLIAWQGWKACKENLEQ